MLRLTPLLAVYVLFVLLRSRDVLVGDEGRYLAGARNLLEGIYASEETLFLWNGPGYPLYLAATIAAGLPLLAAKVGNALFLFLAVVRFHGVVGLLRPAWGGHVRLAASYALGLFLLLHGSLIELLMTEALSAYLVSAAAWHSLRSLREAGWRQAGLAGFHLGYLALTKVFFGYALAAALAGCGAWAVLAALRRRGAGAAARGALACGTGLLLCLPWLAYTFSLTGKPFYWGNSGGSQLYCMTLPEDELLGDWLNSDAVQAHPEFFAGQAPFYRELARMDPVRRDAAMKAAALRNIREHPGKWIRNWRANINRMVFGYPVSRYPGSDAELRTGNRSFVYALPFFLGAFLAWPAWRRRRALPPGVIPCLAFAGLSLAGLSLLSAFPRMVFPLLPLLALGFAAAWPAGDGGGVDQAIRST